MTSWRPGDGDSSPQSPSRCGLAPVIGTRPAVLILGSYPGMTSLSRDEYYAQPQNRFWRVMEALLAIDAVLPYQYRVDALKSRHIALWDVIAACSRAGSSDATISSPVANDMPSLLDRNPSIRLVALNGATGAGRWAKRLLPQMKDRDGLTVLVLPSTSAANARYRLAELVEAWRTVTRFLPPD